MNRKLKKAIVLLMAVMVAIFTMSGCQWLRWRFALEEEQKTKLSEETYSIHSLSLLEALTQGKRDAFILNTATPEAAVQWSNILVSWKQADYYYIAQSFSQFVLNDTLDDWKLKEMF